MIFTRDRCLYTFLASCTDSRLIRSFNSLGSFDDGLFDFPCGRTCGPSCNRPARAPCARARRSVNFSCAIPHAPTRGSHAVAPRGGGGGTAAWTRGGRAGGAWDWAEDADAPRVGSRGLAISIEAEALSSSASADQPGGWCGAWVYARDSGFLVVAGRDGQALPHHGAAIPLAPS